MDLIDVVNVSVENGISAGDAAGDSISSDKYATWEEEDTPVSNGLVNGLSISKEHKEHKHKEHREHKSSEHKHKHKDKDRDRHKDKHKSSSSSKDKDKHHHSSSGSKSHSDKEKHSSSSEHKHKDKHSSSSSHRDKDRHSSHHRDKDRLSSGSRDKDKDRDKERKHKSSSHDKDRHSDKDKEKERHSDKDKHREHKSGESDKEKHREKDGTKKESSGDRHKERKDKDRHKEHRDKHKEHHRSDKPKPVENHVSEPEPVAVKQEPVDYYEEDDEEPRLLIREEPASDDEIPLAKRQIKTEKRSIKEEEDDEEDDVPLAARSIKKIKKESVKRKRVDDDDYDEDYGDYKPVKKRSKTMKKGAKIKEEKEVKGEKEGEHEVWKWWEEEKKEDGIKWNFLEHKGPVFAPSYERLPKSVKFYYDGDHMELSELTEEVAGFYARMIEHDYTTKKVFNDNFFTDWRKCMTSKEKEIIRDLSKCNFRRIHEYYKEKAEEKKQKSKEEKKKIKEQNEETIKKYGFCNIDNHREKIGNFKIEPPGLFRGRGEHPKMGMLKRRVMPEDVIINCSRDSEWPAAPGGHKWKKVQHDPKVTWLACWVENVQNQTKYVMLNPASRLKGEKDWQKYETARKLKDRIDNIRQNYRLDLKSKEMRKRQRAVAMYFIDKLALRAGNEKDEDQADTVGCCSLRVEHISLCEEKDGKPFVVVFDFLGKDSIRYYNEVPVEKRVFKNLQLFMERKQPGDDLFDRLNTAVLNKHLQELMPGLTAKVFRTYNASNTLQQQLDLLTEENASVAEKILAYNRANRAVAILCNHQRAVPKTHAKSMENLQAKIEAKRELIADAEKQVKYAKKAAKSGGSQKEKMVYDKKKKLLERLREQLMKLEVQATDKEENKEIALGTSKLNYLDPRISVSWCKKHEVPIEKIYNKTQRDKFRWAIDMAGPEFAF